MKKIWAASLLTFLILILSACGNPYIQPGVLYSGELNEASEKFVRYLSTGEYWGTFRQEFHNFKAAPGTSYTVTLSCDQGDSVVLYDESKGNFYQYDSIFSLPSGMVSGTALWSPGKSGVVELLIRCSEDYIPLSYTILIEYP